MTLKLSEADRKVYQSLKLKNNMKNYYAKHKEEHKLKCGNTIKAKYENDPEFRRVHIEKVKARQYFKKEFKVLCSIDITDITEII